MMAAMFILYIIIRCRITPSLGPVLPAADRDIPPIQTWNILYKSSAMRLLLWGDRGGYDLGFAAAMKLMKWFPLLTLQ